ncbi:unnamed protein product [Cercospora beticola]|nr:unnamed protein product [Cercospora beticola]
MEDHLLTLVGTRASSSLAKLLIDVLSKHNHTTLSLFVKEKRIIREGVERSPDLDEGVAQHPLGLTSPSKPALDTTTGFGYRLHAHCWLQCVARMTRIHRMC